MKAYYNQEKIASSLRNFFKKFSISKPLLKNLCYIILAMISAESVVTSDFSRKLKDNFSLIHLESIERRFRRFFNSFSSISYSLFETFIKHIISKFCVKHPDNYVHISFDHMFCKDKFTILLFSLRIGRQGIPIWFRCFKGKHNPDAYSMDIIKQGISFCSNLFSDKHYHIIFLADVFFTRKLFKTNIVVPTYIGVDYVKNKHRYHLKIRDTRKLNNRKAYRLYSFFNLGLTIFNLCYYNEINFTLKFNFVLYDV